MILWYLVRLNLHRTIATLMVTIFLSHVDGIFRTSMNSVDLPSIPVQPVSMETAAMLLSNLTGIPAEGSWIGGLNVTYHIGQTGDSKIILYS